jgi:hypothetical protein
MTHDHDRVPGAACRVRLGAGPRPQYARAWEVQGELTALGQHCSAGPVDLVVAAAAEIFGLTLPHHDRDFATITGVTGQSCAGTARNSQERCRR